MMRCLTVALAVMVQAGLAQADCARPETPNCAIQTVPFPADKDADDCRKDMLRYRDASEVYAKCLGQTSADEESKAREAYEDIRARFNKRARGEFGN
jgi:hypothetical protein